MDITNANPEPQPKRADYETAFIVMIGHDGNVSASQDLSKPLTVERESQLPDMRRASSELVSGLDRHFAAQETAQAVAGVLAQLSAAAEEAATNQKIVEKLNQRGIVVPGR